MHVGMRPANGLRTAPPELLAAFESAWGRRGEVISDAGGRVNLVGEHTDYHEGWVLPAAIDLRTRAIGAPRGDGILRIRSLRAGGETQSSIAQLAPPGQGWQGYVRGPFWALRQAGVEVEGADILVDSDVPFGGGLSSSASVQVALVGLGWALCTQRRHKGESSGWHVDRMSVARLAHAAENGFCGVPCGLMDQVASACGRQGHAILLDCRSLDRVEVPIPGHWAMIVADSGVKHALGTSEYAKRQSQCAMGLAVLKGAHPSVRALRDVTLPMLEPWEGRMPEEVVRRLRHAITENDRVGLAREALQGADAGAMARILYASHESLAKDYEVSCPELDILVDVASSISGVIGARLTGAGFGGNTINLVEKDRAEACRDAIQEGYASRTGRRTRALIVTASEGLSVGPI